MAFCRVVFSLLVLGVISCYTSKVPVLLWGDSLKSSMKSNPLTTYTTDEFAAILKQVLVDDPVTLVFVEENLSVEDFSLKNEDGETSFPYLRDNMNEAVYLPRVNEALPTLNKTAGPDAVNIFTDEYVPIGARFVFINLNDAREGESRTEMLRRHDAFMQDTISKMPEELKVVAVYTANYPSWTVPETKSRVRRAAEGTTRSTRMVTVDGLRFTAANILLKTGNDSRVLGELTHTSSELNEASVNATLVFDNTTLVLNFNSAGGYWFFDNVALTVGPVNEVLYPPRGEEVVALLDFSYRCAQFVTFSTVNESQTYTVSFEDIKIQPFFQSNTTQEFGTPYFCVGFFNVPILSGLFVTFILLAITFYGIMMMLDIRTMDRFDDPKGKTITINTGD